MKTHRLVASLSRWTARILGTLLVVLTGYIAVGEGIPYLLTQPMRSQVIFLGIALVKVGILLGCRWELVGGSVTLAGFCLTIVTMTNYAGVTWFFLIMVLPGVLYLASALLRYKNHPQ